MIRDAFRGNTCMVVDTAVARGALLGVRDARNMACLLKHPISCTGKGQITDRACTPADRQITRDRKRGKGPMNQQLQTQCAHQPATALTCALALEFDARSSHHDAGRAGGAPFAGSLGGRDAIIIVCLVQHCVTCTQTGQSITITMVIDKERLQQGKIMNFMWAPQQQQQKAVHKRRGQRAGGKRD